MSAWIPVFRTQLTAYYNPKTRKYIEPPSECPICCCTELREGAKTTDERGHLCRLELECVECEHSWIFGPEGGGLTE